MDVVYIMVEHNILNIEDIVLIFNVNSEKVNLMSYTL